MNPDKIEDELGITDIERGIVPLPSNERSIIGVDLEETIETPDQLFKGVKRLRSTDWFKGLKERGLRAVPLPQKRSSLLILLIGTTAAIGTAYIGYKQYKDRAKKHK